MDKFEITILGCGAAIPTDRHVNAAQLVNVHDNFFLIDCGEGTQTQIRKTNNKLSKINHIFISHAHGDHFFGLLPLISTMSLLDNYPDDVHIYLPETLKPHLEADFSNYCHLDFNLQFHGFQCEKSMQLYDDDELKIETIPMKHNVPCCGFLFSEKSKPCKLLPEKCAEYGIPTSEFAKIKAGNDWVTPDGKVIPNENFVIANDFVPRKFAYCSDTAYFPEIIPQIEGAQLLYHEATYATSELQHAEKYLHSTAAQAATIARDAHVQQLAIGHFSIRYHDEQILLAEAKEIFPNTVICDEGMVLKVGDGQ